MKLAKLRTVILLVSGLGLSAFAKPSVLPPPYRVGFPLVGTIQSLRHHRIGIDRHGHLPAELHVSEGARVTLNGQPARLMDLPIGALVRAQFDVRGKRPEALLIEASADSRTQRPIEPRTKVTVIRTPGAADDLQR